MHVLRILLLVLLIIATVLSRAHIGRKVCGIIAREALFGTTFTRLFFLAFQVCRRCSKLVDIMMMMMVVVKWSGVK